MAKSIRDVHAGRFLLDDALTRRVILRLGANLHRTGREMLAVQLTEREQAVLKMVMQGKSNRAIGDQMGVSDGTVKTHLRNVYRKLHVDGRAAAAAGARVDLWPPEPLSGARSRLSPAAVAPGSDRGRDRLRGSTAGSRPGPCQEVGYWWMLGDALQLGEGEV